MVGLGDCFGCGWVLRDIFLEVPTGGDECEEKKDQQNLYFHFLI